MKGVDSFHQVELPEMRLNNIAGIRRERSS
jgi:hypothetical protein